MTYQSQTLGTQRDFRCTDIGRRGFGDVEPDVARGRSFDYAHFFLPEGLSLVSRFRFLDRDERRLLSQIQGLTYAHMFGLIERIVGARLREVQRHHSRDEEALLGRIADLAAEGTPKGYRFVAQPDAVAEFIEGKSTWAALGLACQLDLSTSEHYRESLVPDPRLSNLYKDVFLFRWKEASRRAVVGELEWEREDARRSPVERDRAVNDLIELVQGIDALLLFQAAADVRYFVEVCARTLSFGEMNRLEALVLGAYRRQFIASGAKHPRFNKMLRKLVSTAQAARIYAELGPILRDDAAPEHSAAVNAKDLLSLNVGVL